jgi:hypothetical protein
MITSQPIYTLSKPSDDNRVVDTTLVYFRERNRLRIFELVLGEFINSGITQACLARRSGRRPEVVNRILSTPGNLTLDTVSDFLFAISGAEPAYGVQYPLDSPPRNYKEPDWLSRAETGTAGASLVSNWQAGQRTTTGGTVTHSEIR